MPNQITKYFHIMKVQYFIFCLCIHFKISNQLSDGMVYEFYPCEKSKKVIETFSSGQNPPGYNVTLVLSEFDFLPRITEIYFYFDIEAKVINNIKDILWYGSDGFYFGASLNIEHLKNLTITVHPKEGFQLPNVINITVNDERICRNGIIRNIWDEYITVNETSTAKPVKQLPKHKDRRPVCGRRILPAEGLIANGYDAKPANWPWHAALFRVAIGGFQSYVCGGTLVSSTAVITAGHCVVEYESVLLPERLVTIFGKFNLYGDNVNVQEKKVFAIVLHPDFSHSTLSNDIAILKLSSEVQFTNFVRPVCLWSDATTPLKYGYVVGWGVTLKQNHSDVLVESQLPIVPDIVCIKSHPIFFVKLQTTGTFCSGSGNGTNVCNGDSGSGMFIRRYVNNIEVWYIKGIVSLGIPTKNSKICDPHQYSLFTDIPRYIKFISDNV